MSETARDPQENVERRLRAAVESAPSGLLMIDASGAVVLVNREVERLFGYSRQDLLGRPVEMLVPPRYRQHHPGFRTSFIAAPAARAMGAGRELFGLRQDGTEVPVEIGLTPVDTPEGLFIISSIVDISARKAAENERRGLEDQLRQAQKLESLGTLAGGIAHDFNNTLAAIVGYCELALERLPAASHPASDLAEVLKAAHRGKQLIQRILAFSRHQEARRSPLDLAATVGDVLELLRATFSVPVEVRRRIDPRAPRIAADATSIHQVVMNLATNAIHAVSGGGYLEVGVEPFYVRDSFARTHPALREGSYALLSVTDTGVGMSVEVRERAFEPFYSTKGPGDGTGLGLTMVHGILRDHDGAVLLDSEPGVGTTVRCFFPALAGLEEESTRSGEEVARGHGERVLLVDDEEALAAIGQRRLSALGYEVSVHTDAVNALRQFASSPESFELVITDYLMPKMTGLDLARELARLRPEIRIILLTGFLEEVPAGELGRPQIRQLLRKPITATELANAVRETLDHDAKAGSSGQSIEGS